MSELSFRPLAPGDRADLTALVSDWEVVRQLGSWPWPPEAELIAQRCRPYDGGDGFIWGIFHEGTFVGTVGVTGGVMGYMIRRADWGRGFATRAGRAALAYAFRAPHLDEVLAETWADNPASMRVLEKLGFRRGVLTEKPSKARGDVVGSVTWWLARERWESLRRAAGSASGGAAQGGATA